jgi:hypothetical protein
VRGLRIMPIVCEAVADFLNPATAFRKGRSHGKARKPRKPVLISGTIAFGGDIINCVVSNMSISGAALDVISPVDIPENFTLIFQTDGESIPCHIMWRKEEHIDVVFD